MWVPFSVKQAHEIISAYNVQIDPLQFLILIPVLLIFVLLRRGTRQDTSRGVLLLLSVQWGIVAVLFFFLRVAQVHWIGYIGGVMYVAVCVYYAVAATKNFPTHFQWRNDVQSRLSLLTVGYATVGYPLSSYLFGRVYPNMHSLALFPGSVALLTLGVVMAARPAPKLALIGPAMFVLFLSPLNFVFWDLVEDAALPAFALIALVGYLRWRKSLTAPVSKDTIRFDF